MGQRELSDKIEVSDIVVYGKVLDKKNSTRCTSAQCYYDVTFKVICIFKQLHLEPPIPQEVKLVRFGKSQ